MRTHPLRPNLALVLACLLALLLFFVGVALPEVHFWASYLLPIVLAFLWGRRRDIYIVAALASVLLVAAFWTGGTATVDDFVTGHLLPLAVVWGLAWLLAQRQQMQERLVAQQQSLEEQVKTRTTALAASEQRYRLLAENAGDLIWTVDMDGNMTYASPAAQRLRGVTGEEEQSASWFDRLPPAAAVHAAAALQADLAALRAGEPIDATPRSAPTYRKDGTLMWTETVMSPMYDDERRPLGLCGTTSDITARKRLEARAERLAALVDAAQDAVISADLDGTIVTINRSAEELYGTSAAAVVGHTMVRLTPPAYVGPLQETLDRVAKGEAMILDDVAWTLPDGRIRSLSVALSPIWDAGGQVMGIASVARDISARRAAERARLYLSALVTSSPDAIVGSAVDGTILSWNHGAELLFGYTADEAIGCNLTMLSAPGGLDQMQADMTAVAQGGPVEDPDTQRMAKDGRVFDCRVSLFPVHDQAGEIIGVASFTHDIGERKRLEDTVNRLAAIVQSSSDAIASTDLQGRVTSWNPSAEQLYGWSAAVAIGHPIYELLPPGPATDEAAIVAKVRSGVTVPVADRVMTKADGTRIDLSIILSPVKDKDGVVVGMASIARDITERKRLEGKLRQSEERFRAMFAEHAAVMLLIDPATGAIVDGNQAAVDFYGYTSAELHAMKIWDISMLPQAEVQAKMRNARNRDWNTFIFPHRLANGTVREVEVHSSPVNVGSSTLLYSIIHDVTARREAEEALRRSEQKWHSVFEFLPVGLSVVDGKDKVSDSNPALADILHMTPEGMLAGTYARRRYFHADMRPMAPEEFPSLRALREGQVVRDVVIGVEKEDGELIWVSVGATPESIDGLALTVTVDITERKRLEDALAASERKFRDLYDNSPDMYVSNNSNGTFRDCNLTAARTLGYTLDELMGLPTSSIFTPASYSRVVAELPKHLAAEARDNFEVQLQCKDGTVLDALLSAQFEPATAEHLAYSRVTFHDITARKRAEQALHESQARYQMLADHATDVIWTMDPACKMTYVSPSVLRQSGFTPEETIGRTLEQTFAPGSRAAARATVGEIYRLIHTGQPVPATPNVFEMLRKDGTTYWGEYIYAAVYNAQGEFQQLVGATREVTERVHAEAQLRDAYQHLQLATDAAGIGIWNWNFADGRLDWDDRMCELYAVTAAERATGNYYDLWRARIHPDDLALVEPTQGDPNRLGSAFAQTYRILLPDGAVRYIQVSSVMEYDQDDKPQRMVGVNRDVTDQKHYEQLLQDTNAVLEEHVAARTAELRTALAELQRAGQLKDEFMAMISHELRTPLTGVLSMSEMLEDQIAGPLNDRQACYVKGIIHSGERLLAVINGILSYTHLLSGKVQLQTEPCDLANVLGICAASQQHKAAAKSQTVAVHVEPPGFAITADATALAEVLKRLLDNAIKFTPDGGQIGLEAHLSSTPGTIDLVVWDTGIGIAADQLDAVFHAFIQADARLSRSHEGIGLGLAYADEMVRLMGGTIRLESTPGEGSRFTITLPAAE